MVNVRLIAGLGLLLAACNNGGGETTGSTSDASSSTGGTDDPTADVPTTSGATGSSGVSGESATGSTSATSSTDTTEGVETATDGTTDGPNTSTTTEGTDSTDGTTGTTGDDTTGSTGTTEGTTDGTTDGSSSTGEPVECVPTERVEVSCDNIDNDCDDSIDNVDVGQDGICDCLVIGILGASGYAPNANFEAWLEDQGSAVTRTLLANKPNVVTPAFLAQYDLVLLDRIERALSADEAKALETFVKADGRGLITLIGYNFDNGNPAPERDRANSALAPFGLAYQGEYFGDAVIPTFNQNHPVSKDIFDVNFWGGMAPVDNGNQGVSTVFANVGNLTAGIAHETADKGGRVVVWGDEWITFDSDWQGYADVQDLWVNMVGWAKPQDFCGAPQ